MDESYETLVRQLLKQAASADNAEALAALTELHERGWLTGDSSALRYGKFRKANWEGADLHAATLYETQLVLGNLRGAKLQKAKLSFVRLHLAYLREANLQGASFDHTSAQSADLRGADLRESWCYSTNLHAADLRGADLRGANLEEVHLQAANLDGAQFDGRTALPDCVYRRNAEGKIIFTGPIEERYTPESFWSPETDMTRYTNPAHPDFWQPCWAMMGLASWMEWATADQPMPWIAAGFGDLAHMEWARAGKPVATESDA